MLTRIRDVRRARGLTLAEVAQRCDPPTTAQTIGRLETGMRTLSMGWLGRIAAALDVAAADLVTLPDRIDVPVAAILGADGARAPAQVVAIAPPQPGPGQIALSVEVSQGDYRARDTLWLDQLAPAHYAGAINRDVLAPRPVGRFVFGRLVQSAGEQVHLLPIGPGARQIVLSDVPWLGVVRTLLRPL